VPIAAKGLYPVDRPLEILATHERYAILVTPVIPVILATPAILVILVTLVITIPLSSVHTQDKDHFRNHHHLSSRKDHRNLNHSVFLIPITLQVLLLFSLLLRMD